MKIYFYSLFLSTLFFVPINIIAQNLLDTSTWTVGSGPVSGFNNNGSNAENIRELSNDHLGNEIVIWKAIPDASSNIKDGGWDTDFINIDHTKKHRLTVWIKKTNTNDGITVFRCYSINPITGVSQIQNLNGTINTKPRFFYGDLPELNKWYLLVGFVHSSNGIIQNLDEGRIYDGITGQSVSILTDFQFSNNASTLIHSAYLNNDNNINNEQYFTKPRIDVVDGTEPSINDLLGINENSSLIFEYDLAGNQKRRFYCPLPFACNGGGIMPPEEDELNQVFKKEDHFSETYYSDKLLIEPNPTNGIVKLHFLENNAQYNAIEMALFTASGLLISNHKITNNEDEIIIDLSKYPTGTYFLHVHLINGKSYTKKIIKK